VRFKPYGAFIDIGGVSGLLHISDFPMIDTPHSVFNVNDEVKEMMTWIWSAVAFPFHKTVGAGTGRHD